MTRKLNVLQSEANLNIEYIPKQARSLIIIDSSVDNIEILKAGLKPGAEVVVLHPQLNGIEQITTLVSRRKDLQKVHLISHGSPGSLKLGDSELNLSNINNYSAEIQTWFASSSDRISFLIYGCQVAFGEEGSNFVQKLHELTGADLAAATKIVGSPNDGGVWELDYEIGTINSKIAFTDDVIEAYSGTFMDEEPEADAPEIELPIIEPPTIEEPIEGEPEAIEEPETGAAEVIEEPESDAAEVIEEPEADAPEATEELEADAPEIEPPVIEPPVIEETEDNVPEAIEEPGDGAPEIEPEADAPEAIEEPEADAPEAIEEPEADAPEAIEEPEADAPEAIEEPEADAPEATEEPEADAPEAIEEPEADAPEVIEEPEADAPVIEPPVIEDFVEGEPVDSVIDLSAIAEGEAVNTVFNVEREAGFDNTVDFYEVNANGSVIDPDSGDTIAFGDSGYADVALANRVGLELTTENGSTSEFTAELEGGKFYAPVIAVDSDFEALSDDTPDNDPTVYFTYSDANADGFDHVRNSEPNVFEFEDLPNGGDLDFNDVVVDVSFGGSALPDVPREPIADTPALELPVIEEPGDDAPEAIEEPIAEAPALEPPAINSPVIEDPVEGEPVADAPGIEPPLIEDPLAEEPGADVGDVAIIQDGTTSVALDTELLSTAAGLTISSNDNTVEPVSDEFAVGFDIIEGSDLTFNDQNGFTPIEGEIEHTGTVTFESAAGDITVGDFTVGFDPARQTTDISGFFVQNTVDGAVDDAILFDVSTPEVFEASGDELNIADADLLVAPEFADILLSTGLAEDNLTGSDIGDVAIDAIAAPLTEIPLESVDII